MSDEHGWLDLPGDDHHDGGHHDGPELDDPGHPAAEPLDGWDDQHDDVAGHDDTPGYVHAADHDPPDEPSADDTPESYPESFPADEQPEMTLTAGHTLGHVGADPDAAAEAHDPDASTFPPLVDVGALPEPIDGFPWIDTDALGSLDDILETAERVTAGELAAYAGTELPPGADPWQSLLSSDDPATRALARWWRPDAS